jgi:hypothetical protein
MAIGMLSQYNAGQGDFLDLGEKESLTEISHAWGYSE